MSNYPKIYSISTVGIRQHENADFLFHPIRTDFTGDNGLGKSIIADLMQLIFIPLRDEWKPGTEGVKKEARRIETIPLERNWISHSYSFINIEIRKNKFIAIGVYIPRNQRSPVRPFIIQKSDDFENKKTLLPFDKPLSFSDFLADNQQILDLKGLERNLFQKHQIHFKDFFQEKQIEEYFDLLFKNQIIPIQLTIKSNLKSFAKILQSFSRAKTLDINKSSSLQNFLFEDNEEIKFNFDKEKENLAGYIKEYNDHSREINLIDKKQKRLEELQSIHINYEESRIEYLKNNALFNSNKYLITKKAFDNNETQYTETLGKYNSAKKDLEDKTIKLLKNLLEQKDICNRLRVKLETQKAETGNENIEKLRTDLRKKQTFVERLEELKPLKDEIKSVEKIEIKLQEQDIIKEKQKKLTQLKSIVLFDEFEKSKWIENFKESYDYYTERAGKINLRLSELNTLLELYKGNNPDSLFNWALNRKKVLTCAEETVLLNFKNIFTKQINATLGAKYTLTPQTLLSSYEEDKTGIWLKLGDIREYIPYVEKQIFDEPLRWVKVIEQDKKEVENEMKQLKIELNSIVSLHTQLQNIGYNQDFVEIFKARKMLEGFIPNKLLTEDNMNFIKVNFRSFGNIKGLKLKNQQIQGCIDMIVIATDSIRTRLSTNQKILDKVLSQITRIPKDSITKPIDIDPNIFSELPIEDLIAEQEKYADSIELLFGERTEAENRKKRYEGEMNSHIQAKPDLESEKNKFEKNFSEAKDKLHNETEIRFDTLLPLGNLSEEFIESLKTDFDKKEKRYTNEFSGVAEAFEDTKKENKHPEIYLQDDEPNYSFQTLVNVLCGKLGLEGLTPELTRLNEKRKEFGDLQLKILINVFEQVEKQYNEYHSTITRLNLFFNDNKVSKVYKFKIEFTPRTEIGIDWIERMKDRARVHKYGPDLFNPEVESTPETLIKSIAKTFYHSIDCDPTDLLNPKFYFNLNVRMENEQGKSNAGSSGQAYTALALLCIGRLSIVQKQQERPGVRFIIIEELSNIDDTNFNIFPQIANEFGYQLLTMTTKPFGSYTNEEWYLHMLVWGTEPDRNYTAMSFFKNKYEGVELSEYLTNKNELESIKTT